MANKKVYIVLQCIAYEGEIIEGVYASEEQALAFANKLGAKSKWPVNPPKSTKSRDFYCVEEYKVINKRKVKV